MATQPVVVQVTFRDGATKATHRSGTSEVTHRDGVATGGGR